MTPDQLALLKEDVAAKASTADWRIVRSVYTRADLLLAGIPAGLYAHVGEVHYAITAEEREALRMIKRVVDSALSET